MMFDARKRRFTLILTFLVKCFNKQLVSGALEAIIFKVIWRNMTATLFCQINTLNSRQPFLMSGTIFQGQSTKRYPFLICVGELLQRQTYLDYTFWLLHKAWNFYCTATWYFATKLQNGGQNSERSICPGDQLFALVTRLRRKCHCKCLNICLRQIIYSLKN